jgi:hypothetical protein
LAPSILSSLASPILIFLITLRRLLCPPSNTISLPTPLSLKSCTFHPTFSIYNNLPSHSILLSSLYFILPSHTNTSSLSFTKYLPFFAVHLYFSSSLSFFIFCFFFFFLFFFLFFLF